VIEPRCAAPLTSGSAWKVCRGAQISGCWIARGTDKPSALIDDCNRSDMQRLDDATA
jgi:hypothetical protein